LRENAGTAPSIWRSRAELTAEGLTLRDPQRTAKRWGSFVGSR
jgi:hypothetical protein